MGGAGAGLALNAPLPLTIRQRGEPPIRLTARYATHAFSRPLYYAFRVERWTGRGSWGAELVHHKIYLRNPPPEVQRFAVSHGFNVVTLLRSRGKADGTAVRLGAGIVVAHPEITVRGRELPENGGILGLGYVVAGPALQAAVVGHAGRGRPQALGEAKLVGAFAHVPVAGGSADIWNASAHAQAGIAYRF